MPGLLDTTELRERFDIHRDIGVPRLDMTLRSGARRLREWVGAALYAEVVAQRLADTSTLTEAQQDRLNDFKDCEAHLAMHFLVLNVQTQVRKQGLVAEEKLAEGGTIIRLHNAEAMETYVENYLQQAEEIIRPYRAFAPESTYEFAALPSV